jgi:tetratricopeptide (TPR) repeat protein
MLSGQFWYKVSRSRVLASALAMFVAPLIAQQAGGTNIKAVTPAARAQQTCIQTEAAFILHRDRAKARQGFQDAIEIDRRYAPAWFDLAVLAEGDKEWAKAASYFRQYLSLQPTGADATRARAQLQLLSRYLNNSAVSDAARDTEYDVAIQRARALLAHGYFRESVAEAGRAQSLDRSRWESYAVVSLCMEKQDKPQEAARFEALALEHAPTEKRGQIQAALSSAN